MSERKGISNSERKVCEAKRNEKKKQVKSGVKRRERQIREEK
jgi:hypothetical protein